MLFQIAFFFHLVAFFLIGGGSLGTYVAEQQLWKKLGAGAAEAVVLLPVLENAVKLIQVGVILFFLSGLLLLLNVHFVYLSQPWFIIKFILFVALPIRGAKIARPLVGQISKQIATDVTNKTAFEHIKKKMIRFHVIQYSIAAIIVLLAILKP